MRAERAELTAADLQRRFDEQARELTEARARIAELERLLAEARGELGEQEQAGEPQDSSQPGSTGGDQQSPGGHAGEPSGRPPPRPRPASSRPGIMEVRRQLSQALATNAELRALGEELRRQIAMLERRCAELEQQLQRALSLAVEAEPRTDGQLWNADDAARVQERASILMTELEQVRRERAEVAEQRDWLSTRLTNLLIPDGGTNAAPSADYSAARTELFSQIRRELEVRDRFADWESEHRTRESDRRLDPTRTLDEQALAATLAVRWQLMDHAPQSFRLRPRWVVEGLLLDPASEQFLIRQSRERVVYRERSMAKDPAPVASPKISNG
ncbi:hypothetical protein [Haliangium sp. UPWRP_2]|uniref:hypothetical protein n=1 Tax=Haliangium sp. UPWRP_2 TaxID=1931276 RepID=UPI000B543AA5|nr:hypothetical protein [Haliangium sp. UPWRP_2]PSM31406.1 hypothetical protein BVG81_005535 [Haliangium sp. UPWRP_2]